MAYTICEKVFCFYEVPSTIFTLKAFRRLFVSAKVLLEAHFVLDFLKRNRRRDCLSLEVKRLTRRVQRQTVLVMELSLKHVSLKLQ
jgi:hypothetical protein